MAERLVEVAPDRLTAWLDRFTANNPGPDPAQRVVAVDRFDHDPLALLLLRRGGYAVGLVAGGSLVAHKTGTRYVQSRTKAGGWSQQRYARRRGNQADELVDAAAGHLARILTDRVPAQALVIGGDRQFVADALRALPEVAGLPRRELFDLPDPRLDVLRTALERARAVRVTIEE